MTRLCLAIVIVSAVWLGVLPWLADVPPVRTRIEFFESSGVNPGAIRYSELPEIPGALERQRRRTTTDPRAFWGR